MAGFEEQGAGGGGVVSAFGKKVRLATEDETFDLAGMNEQQVHDAMLSAFSEPWSHLSGMIRLTFIVGGGKLVRQRYDEDMGRWVSQALKSIGFEEDKSAVADLASRRRFKHHHDTGKNLKTFVVFPDVPDQPAGGSGGGQGGEAAEEEGSGGEWEVEVALECPVGVFGDMATAMAPTWWQKQKLVKDVLTPRVERVEAIERKMMAGEKLDDRDTQEYEVLSSANLKEKVEWLTAHMKAQVDEGHLTASDIDKLKAQVEGRLSSVREELDKAKAEALAKKVEKLEGQVKALEERRTKLHATTPITHPLRKQEELTPLWRRQALLQHEKAAIKGRLLTLPELRKFSEIDRLEEQIVELVRQSRTFFEDEEHGLQARAQSARKKAVAGVAAKKKAAATAGGSSKPASSSQWSSVGVKKKPASSGGGSARKAGGNAFAALGGDSDSD